MERKISRVGRLRATPVTNPDPLMREADAAAYLGITEKTLANWRYARLPTREIPFVQLGGRGGVVLYRQSVLDAYLKRCESAQQASAA